MLDKIKKLMVGKTKKDSRSPTLETIEMVEGFIKENSGKYKKTELFKKLPRKVMWQTYQKIMAFLEENYRIIKDNKGFLVYVWIPELTEGFKEVLSYAGITKGREDKLKEDLKKGWLMLKSNIKGLSDKTE